MESQATLIVAIVGVVLTYTISVVSLVLWLTGKFRAMEATFYRELGKHRDEDTQRFFEQGNRIYRLELTAFGATKIP